MTSARTDFRGSSPPPVPQTRGSEKTPPSAPDADVSFPPGRHLCVMKGRAETVGPLLQCRRDKPSRKASLDLQNSAEASPRPNTVTYPDARPLSCASGDHRGAPTPNRRRIYRAGSAANFLRGSISPENKCYHKGQHLAVLALFYALVKKRHIWYINPKYK